ncbi:recombinase family protein [Streptomyces griseoaurantiacus]|uniref:recombinase family protein n=1 Tax=Streptomyces griseoaurantiacus TaxID=68213 RepID=UPI0034607A06
MDAGQRVDLYLRRSKKGALELSTAAQEARGREWAERNGLTVRHVWTDKLSGSRKDVKRPDYDKALAALSGGEIKTLWCYKLDRFSRMGAVAVLTILDELTGARIIFDSDGLDSSDPTHRRMIMWRAEDAKEEAERIGERLRDTFGAAKSAGMWVPSKVPFGFTRTADRRLAIDEKAAAIVRRIFADAIAGTSMPKLCRALNDEEIPSPSGGRWSTSTLYGILQHPTYAGWAARLEGHKRVPYRDAKGNRVRVAPPIVSEADHAKAADALTSRTKTHLDGSKRGDRSTPRHLLTGLLRCAACGRKLVASSGSYRCTAASLGGAECSAPASVQRKAIEFMVGEAWISRLAASEPEDELIHAVAKRWIASHKPDAVAERNEATQRVEEAQAGLRDLLDARYRRKEFEGEAMRYFPDLLADAEAAVDTARRELGKLPEPTADIGYLLDGELVREAWAVAPLEDRRDLLQLAVDEVRVTKGQRGYGLTRERVEYVWATE